MGFLPRIPRSREPDHFFQAGFLPLRPLLRVLFFRQERVGRELTPCPILSFREAPVNCLDSEVLVLALEHAFALRSSKAIALRLCV